MKNLFKNTFPLDEKKFSLAGVSKKKKEKKKTSTKQTISFLEQE